MKRVICSVITVALVGVMVLPAAGQQQASSNPLSIIPADAIAFVCVQNLKQLDERIGAVVQELGLGPMIPPAYSSVVTMLREYGPLGDGLDENGALAMVMLNAETPDELMANGGLIVSATDPAALLESMNPEPSEDGTSKVMLFGKPSFALPKKNAVLIAPTPTAAQALAKEGPGMDTKLQAGVLKAMARLDVVCWMDAARGLKLCEPMIDEFVTMFKAGAGAGAGAEEGSLQAIQAEGMIESIDMLKEGAEAAHFGLSLGQSGLGLQFSVRMKPGSKLAKMSNVQEATTKTLLVGLPQENYIVALGQVMTAEQAAEGVKWMTRYLGANEVVEVLGKENAEQIKADLEEWYGGLRGMSVLVSSLPPGPEGLIGVSAVCKVTDSGQWLSKLEGMVTRCKEIKTENEWAQALLNAVAYKPGAGTIDGVSVTELSLDIGSMEDVEPEDLEQMHKVLGKDGVLLRLAAVDGKHVAAAFGGGESRMGELIAHAKSGKAPLGSDAGIRRVADNLPKAKASECYIALDRMVGLVRNVTEAIGEGDAFPISMSEVNAPIAVVGSGEKGLANADIYLPMELVVAVKNTVMQAMGMMMGGGMQAGMGGPPTGSVDDDLRDEDEDAEEAADDGGGEE